LSNKSEDSGVWMDKVVASWYTKEEQNEPTLKSLTFSVKPGELIVIVGNKGIQKCSFNTLNNFKLFDILFSKVLLVRVKVLF